MIRLSSDDVELRLLSFFFRPPFHTKSTSINREFFTKLTHRRLFELIQAFVRKYQTPPTKKTLISFSEEFISKKEDVKKYADALSLLSGLPKIKSQEFNYYINKAENYYVGRTIFDLAEGIKNDFENNLDVDFRSMRKKLLRSLLISAEDDRRIKRGFIYENVKERWGEYKKAAAGEAEDLIPFGISKLDEKLGGMRKSFVTLMYSKTGGGKTRTSVNIAYNVASKGYKVMYFSLEMAFNFISACFDSRMSLIDGNSIIYGKLDSKDIKKYKKALKRQVKEKFNVWLVDIPHKASTDDIYQEIEIYKAMNGSYPDLVIIDYANLMAPVMSYNGRSEKYDFLFKEYHEIARYTNTCILTATMESRERSKLDKARKRHNEEEREGVEGIGLSNYMAPHCEIVLRLRQTREEALRNKLFVVVDKHRYAKAYEEIELCAVWALNYVGDRLIPGTSKIKILKQG